MTNRKESAEARELREKQEEALKIMADKDPEFATDAATSNERMATSDDLTTEQVKASLDANNPAGSHASYRDEKAEQKLAEKREKEA